MWKVRVCSILPRRAESRQYFSDSGRLWACLAYALLAYLSTPVKNSCLEWMFGLRSHGFPVWPGECLWFVQFSQLSCSISKSDEGQKNALSLNPRATLIWLLKIVKLKFIIIKLVIKSIIRQLAWYPIPSSLTVTVPVTPTTDMGPQVLLWSAFLTAREFDTTHCSNNSVC